MGQATSLTAVRLLLTNELSIVIILNEAHVSCDFFAPASPLGPTIKIPLAHAPIHLLYKHPAVVI
jgi:hypothetical protein